MKHPIRNTFLTLLLIGIVILYWIFFIGFRKKPTFDFEEVAASETRMWKAYYNKERNVIAKELVNLQVKQFGLPIYKAIKVAKPIAEAAEIFGRSSDNYEKKVLPKLTSGYKELKKALKRDFDPKAVAKAELAWWIARRMPGQNNPENVGNLIGDLYAKLYGKQRKEFLEAGRLRAFAAAKRDLENQVGASNVNWSEIENMLRQSYKMLNDALISDLDI